jgi:hypothetical protein
MIKYISKRIEKNDPELNEQIVLQGIKRNFGGNPSEMAIRALEQSEFKFMNTKIVKEVYPDILIKENLNDMDSRHTMIITDN